MATQRYQTIMKDEVRYYSKNCPACLSSYAILYDHKEKKYIAQLKLKNCSSKTIDSVRLTLRAYNQFGELSEELNNCEYTAVNASSGSEFGAKSLKPLSGSASVKRLGITINNVVFTDGQEWASDEGESMEAKIDVEPLASALSDEEIEAYRSLTNPKMQYVPFRCDPSWVCSCGELNYDSSICTACGSEKTKVFEFIEKEYLRNTILKNKYENALSNKKVGTISSLQQAIAQFEELGNYKDSGSLLDDCKHELVSVQRAEEDKKREEERQAEIRKLEAEEKAKKNKKTVIILATVAVICLTGVFISTNVIIPNSKYNAAVTLMENGDYDEAIEAFKALGDYKDSTQKIEECNSKKLEDNYSAAITLMENGDYDKAIKAFEALGNYKDSAEKIEECKNGILENKYIAAVKLMENEEYTAAYKAFEEIIGYKDSAELQASIRSEYEIELISDAGVGDNVLFGVFEQDNDEKNGAEPIEWIVLSKEDDRALLISMYGLDKQFYNDERESVTWGNSSLREWLNSSFYNAAFASGEQKRINATFVEEDTEDKVFILSPEEAEEFFTTDEKRQCELTSYAWDRGASLSPDSEKCFWLLREPGTEGFGAYVDGDDGSIKNDLYFNYYNGRYYNSTRKYGKVYTSVRPALWVNLSSVNQ